MTARGIYNSGVVDDVLAGMQKLLATVFPYGGPGIVTNRIKAGGTEPLNIGWGLNVSDWAAGNTDTALFEPAAEARVAGTSSRTTTNANVPNDTYQVVGTIVSMSAQSITEFGQFDTSGVAPTTTLTASATSGATSLSIAATGTFPGAGTYYCQLDQEVIAVTGGQGTTTWTVTRGARGSSAATHVSGAIVVGGEATSGANLWMKSSFTSVALASGDSVAFTASTQFLP